MKKVEAIIQPFVLDDVRDALIECGVHGMSITEVKGVDPQRHAAWYRGLEYVTWFSARIKIEVVVADEQVDRCVDAISRGGQSDEMESGEIVVLPVEETIQIRSGERQLHAAHAA
jgi:nitrogen regulatory protein P-II 1